MDEIAIWESASASIILPVVLLFVFVLFLSLQEKYGRESHLNLSDKKHNWQCVSDFTKSYRCSGCHTLLVKGVVCDTCGLSADAPCMNKVGASFVCKEVSLDSQQPFKHRWIGGNFPIEVGCEVCSEDYSKDWKWKRCIWCHKTVHIRCQLFLGEVCDFGKLRQVIIPPTHVEISKKKSRMVRGGFKLRSISDPNISDWSPVFVVANKSSGSQAADEILSRFRSLFNPLQTLELSSHSLKRLVFILTLLPQSCKPIILIAGGDGTVASVITLLYKNRKNIKCDFRVGIVPLGTGNDLSRVLGWGKEESTPFSAHQMLNKLLTSTPLSMDRWEVNIVQGRRLGISRPAQVKFMYNYMSVGVDARVTLDFHNARNSSLYLGGRLINKALYLAFGTQQVVDRVCIGLEKKIEVELDGLKIQLPELEAVVILNIASWGAGCHVWELKEPDEHISEQSMSDGKLEVIGIYSSFHMAQMQVGLSSPYRIGQASNVKIILKTREPMQMDGEPWMQSPCVVEVKFGGQVTVLKAPEDTQEEAGDETMSKEF
ncbi:diacylglycerol kinase epsilon [Halyomorpha halys]|uniref:diacylglycerol kinase epsilon n=1 Tax=Halyomorpha halys TaxID=286706 RepID=UPI0006D5065B|nr:diacylglycerol kinase epsilon isoform X1 [Halyomorpha halys]